MDGLRFFFAGIYIIELHNKGAKIGLPKRRALVKDCGQEICRTVPKAPTSFTIPQPIIII